MKLSKLIKEYEKRKKLHVEKMNEQNKLIKESGGDFGVEALHEMFDKIFTNQITITAIDDFIMELKKVVVEKEGIKRLNDAAPELLEVCKMILFNFETNKKYNAILNEAEIESGINLLTNAIKKATE